jgi:hypothetical protein
VNVDARIRIAGGALRGSPAIKISFLPSSGIASYSPASALTTAPDFQAFSNAALVGNPTQVTVKVKGCIQHSEALIRRICRFEQKTFTASATAPITIAPTFAAVEVGKSMQFTSNQSVTWSISNRQGGPTISSSGLFRSDIPGSFFVRATSTSDPTKFGETLVRVTPHAPFMASTYEGTYTENGITVQASAIFVRELGQPLLFVARLPTGHQALFQVSDYSDASFVHGAGDEVFGTGTAVLPSQPIQAGATISLSFATTEGGIRFNGAGRWPNP